MSNEMPGHQSIVWKTPKQSFKKKKKKVKTEQISSHAFLSSSHLLDASFDDLKLGGNSKAPKGVKRIVLQLSPLYYLFVYDLYI